MNEQFALWGNTKEAITMLVKIVIQEKQMIFNEYTSFKKKKFVLSYNLTSVEFIQRFKNGRGF